MVLPPLAFFQEEVGQGRKQQGRQEFSSSRFYASSARWWLPRGWGERSLPRKQGRRWTRWRRWNRFLGSNIQISKYHLLNQIFRFKFPPHGHFFCFHLHTSLRSSVQSPLKHWDLKCSSPQVRLNYFLNEHMLTRNKSNYTTYRSSRPDTWGQPDSVLKYTSKSQHQQEGLSRGTQTDESWHRRPNCCRTCRWQRSCGCLVDYPSRLILYFYIPVSWQISKWEIWKNTAGKSASVYHRWRSTPRSRWQRCCCESRTRDRML